MGIDLSGKAGIVTGGASGIAKGMSTALLKAGMAVTVTDINPTTLASATEFYDTIEGARHLALIADGTSDDDVNNAVRQTADTFGRIDLVINCAQASVGDLEVQDHTVETIMVGIDSGFLASFRYMKAAYPYLKESQGSVVNFASQAGLIGNWGMLPYNAAKEAIRALTRTAAREWGKDNISVNTIIPGSLTEGSKAFFDAHPEHYKHSMENIPMGRLGDPEKDLGALAVFLASEGSKYITGDTFNMDGGRVLRP
jgi:NAD(P)-dependent dehydrogenase (short-subunit alcohol dehydrogenase family)